MEVALLLAAKRAGLTADALRRRFPEIREEAFDPALKMMATYHADDGKVRVAVKGAPEAVLPVCTRRRDRDGSHPMSSDDQARWERRAAALGAEGLRVLMVASKVEEDPRSPPYEELELLGIVALRDPPRSKVRQSIERCMEAGVRVVMVTGDQTATADSVARAVGIVEDDATDTGPLGRELDESTDAERILAARVIARASPEQKLKLLRLHQEAGNVVAMIGDGVNDAPALKQANIGVAMGGRGTQIAREAADMVLQDDDFATIIVAIEQGRVIFDNIRKFVVYLISCNLGEILVVGLASLAQAPLPVLPMQILFLNLVTDVFPALALGAGEGAGSEMQRQPRRADAPLLDSRDWWRVAGFAVIVTVPVLMAEAVALLGLDLDPRRAVTVSFLTLAFSQLVHVFNMADPGSRFFDSEVTRNRLVWGALALCTALLLAAVYLPGLRDVLALADPGMRGWAVVAVLSLVPLIGRPFAVWARSRTK
jgi:Ca2+-transporting ATPase